MSGRDSKLCCIQCFDDRWFESFNNFDDTGNCSYCGATGVSLFDPRKLTEQFEILLAPYDRAGRKDLGAKSLCGHLSDDWNLFGDLKASAAQALLCKIYGDKNRALGLYKLTKQARTSGAFEQWEEFKKEIITRNRFFFSDLVRTDDLRRLMEVLVHESGRLDLAWYRARIGPSCFDSKDMGAPPAYLASHGRANPIGIPYLYLSSRAYTAIAETRPHPGDGITVGEFVITSNLRFLDLRNPRKTASPLSYSDEDAVVSLRSDIDFLVHLGDELKRPVRPDKAAIEYLPTQFLCEFAKTSGFDGVLYSSAISAGFNLALFDTEWNCLKTEFRTVTKLNVETDPPA